MPALVARAALARGTSPCPRRTASLRRRSVEGIRNSGELDYPKCLWRFHTSLWCGLLPDRPMVCSVAESGCCATFSEAPAVVPPSGAAWPVAAALLDVDHTVVGARPSKTGHTPIVGRHRRFRGSLAAASFESDACPRRPTADRNPSMQTDPQIDPARVCPFLAPAEIGGAPGCQASMCVLLAPTRCGRQL